jgi:FAD/FMN-containing dehydrogenase
MAPTFSSTTGIQISIAGFSDVLYVRMKELVKVGAGCLWDQVYSKLAPFGRNVSRVGVGGWLLGGGYSLKSNQYIVPFSPVICLKIHHVIYDSPCVSLIN